MTDRVILASTSRYRGELLRRLLPEFDQQAPDVDEALRLGEPPATRAMRLAVAKARGVAETRPGTIVIGSDQVASIGDTILRKPGDATTARQQLEQCAGAMASFHTALCVIDAASAQHTDLDVTQVYFRPLDEPTIARYVDTEQPLDCAGSFKCEGLGIALFEHIDSADPTALIGLPLIATARLLRECGLALP